MPELIRGRYAPSPTGALHLGNARTALLAWLQARARGGAFVLRIEDLDRPRAIPGAAERICEELRWLGLDWDEGPDVGGPCGPYIQSLRTALYDEAISSLKALGRLYPCFCSRQEIARASSAPHGPQDDGPRYPGTCRDLSPEAAHAKAAAGRSPALRFRVAPGPSSFCDGLRGPVAIDLEASVGDFVVRRADGLHAYQLAVAVDDARMGITDVLRGDDLLTSTPRQIQLFEALGLAAPRYWHAPLVLGPGGERLAKRNGEAQLGSLRASGVAPERIVAELARSAGLADERAVSARELAQGFDLARLPRGPVIVHSSSLF